MSSAGKRAIIIGGSMGGLFSGLSLLRAGWDVDVFERVDVELSARGAGIVTHPELDQALAGVGLKPDATPGVQIEERRTLDREGKVVARHARLQTATSWNGLFRLLRGAFPSERYHLGREFAGCEVRSDAVKAWFADGSSESADVLIGADGIRSSVRVTSHGADWWTRRASRPRFTAISFRTLRSACRRASKCSAIPSPAVVTTCGLGIGNTTLSGTDLPTRPP